LAIGDVNTTCISEYGDISGIIDVTASTPMLEQIEIVQHIKTLYDRTYAFIVLVITVYLLLLQPILLLYTKIDYCD